MIRKVFSILLILVGILFLFVPFLTEQIIRHYSKNSIMETVTVEEIEGNKERDVAFDYSLIKDVDISAAIDGVMHFDSDYMIGILEIPNINIRLPIYKGLTNANLVNGAATMKADQSMGQGNFTLAGHNMRNKNLLFGRLMDIEVGSRVILTDKRTIYEYSVYETQVVPDSATDMLLDEKADQRGKPIVSLMTCYHSSRTGKRFFALGELVDQYPAIGDKMD